MQSQVIPAENPLATAPSVAPNIRGPKLAFCKAFLRTPNARLAAKAAGAKFGKEAVVAQQMMDDPKVRAYLVYHQTLPRSELRASRERIRDEMAALAMSNPIDAVELDAQGKIKRIRVDRLDGRDIKKLKFTPGKTSEDPDHVEIDFHPKQESLRLLGQDAGMFADEGKPLPTVTVRFGNLKNSNVQVNVGGKGE